MYVISYDISSDRIRNRAAETLLEYGRRIQYSVFECEISKSRFDSLYSRLCELNTEEMDYSIRFYQICENCIKKTRVIGDFNEKDKFKREEVIII